MTESKPGIATTEFWLVILANLLVNVGAIDVGVKYRGLLAVLSTVGYVLSRGLAKAGVPAAIPGADEPEQPLTPDPGKT